MRYSLELSALRHSLDQPQREAIAKTAVATLCSATAPLGSSSAASGVPLRALLAPGTEKTAARTPSSIACSFECSSPEADPARSHNNFT